MTWKTWLALSCALAASIVAAPVDRAQDAPEEPPAPPEAPPSPAPQPAPATPAPTAEKHWYGEKFGLYVEVGFGQSDAEEITSPVRTSPSSFTEAFVNVEGQDFGRAAVGWTLTNGRGTFLIAFEGYRESSYEFNAIGYQAALGEGDVGLPTEPIVWWNTTIQDGLLVATRTPPRWNQATDDANGDGLPNPDEIRYPAADATVRTSVPDDLIHRTRTLDFLYQRDFGGRRFSGRWDVGLRSFQFEGNIPATAWLSTAIAGQGYTDGAEIRLLNFFEETSGLGPTFSLEAQFHFFKKRLQLYAKSRGSFLSETLKADSGDFTTLARDLTNGAWYLAPARLKEDITKSVWNFGAEAGVRFRILEGFWLNLGYSHQAFQDAILLPNQISVPSNIDQIGQGTVGVYATQDLTMKTIKGGVSFQF
jgi:hypothetical protein